MKITAVLASLLLGVIVTGSEPALATAVVIVPASGEPGGAGEAVTGAWLQPKENWDGRAVLMLHGFADDMDGPADIVKRLAERLAAEGIASLRINFRGEGDKQRTQIESTFALRLADTAAAQAWLLGRPGVKAERTGALGFSLGATTAIVTAGNNPGWFRSIAVWSSPSGDMLEYYLKTSETARTALREGVATEEVPGWKKITTRREFYESFRGADVDQALAKYPGAFLSVRGSADFLPQHEAQFMKILAANGPASVPQARDSGEASMRTAEAVLISGADHIFNVFQPELGLAERAVQVTVEWFGRTL